MKYKQGKLFKRITKSQDYHRIGKENWEKLKKDESVDFEPPNMLVISFSFNVSLIVFLKC